MASVVIKLSVVLMFVAVCAAVVFSPRNSAPPPVTEVCLKCICQASSGCIQNVGCSASGDVCGMFAITRPYWIDAGRPTVDGSSGALNAGTYTTCGTDPDCANCANDPHCAARTVQAYMKRFPQDCNGDGQVDCFDYASIHRKGGYECSSMLPDKYALRFFKCMAMSAGQRCQ